MAGVAAKAGAPGGGRRGGSGTAEAKLFRDVERLQRVAQFTSGALAGLVNTLVLSPLDVVKTRLQTQGAAGSVARYTGVGNTLRMILREEGAMSYYKGLSASLWAFVPNWAIYWFTYEELKRRLGVNAMAATMPSGAGGPGGTQGQPDSRLLPFAYMASAVGAGAVTAVTTAPFWVVKTRMQLDVRFAHDVLSEWSGLAARDCGLMSDLGHGGKEQPCYEDSGQDAHLHHGARVASSFSPQWMGCAWYRSLVLPSWCVCRCACCY